MLVHPSAARRHSGGVSLFALPRAAVRMDLALPGVARVVKGAAAGPGTGQCAGSGGGLFGGTAQPDCDVGQVRIGEKARCCRRWSSRGAPRRCWPSGIARCAHSWRCPIWRWGARQLRSGREARGAVFVDDLDAVPGGVRVVFSTPRSAFRDANRGGGPGCEVIDGTCPLVTKVHAGARRFHRWTPPPAYVLDC